MGFIEAPVFTRHLSEYLADELFREMQAFLIANPDAGDVIQGSGGFRMLRWLDNRRQTRRIGSR